MTSSIPPEMQPDDEQDDLRVIGYQPGLITANTGPGTNVSVYLRLSRNPTKFEAVASQQFATNRPYRIQLEPSQPLVEVDCAPQELANWVEDVKKQLGEITVQAGHLRRNHDKLVSDATEILKGINFE